MPDGHEVLEVGIDLIHIRVRQLDHPAVLPDPLQAHRAGDGDDDGHAGALRQAGDPVDGELGRRAALLRRPLLHLLDQLEVRREVLGLVARALFPEAPLREILEALDFPGENTVG